MENRMERQEIFEAIQAGERAMNSLQRAKEYLNSAGNWGLVDLFGGGFISSMMKHSKMSDASRYLEQAKQDLRYFQKELRDVQMLEDLSINVDGFLSFADFFFDGLVADYLVQSKIEKSKKAIQDALRRTEQILTELYRLS